jgi:hypothetical protein
VFSPAGDGSHAPLSAKAKAAVDLKDYMTAFSGLPTMPEKSKSPFFAALPRRGLQRTFLTGTSVLYDDLQGSDP